MCEYYGDITKHISLDKATCPVEVSAKPKPKTKVKKNPWPLKKMMPKRKQAKKAESTPRQLCTNCGHVKCVCQTKEQTVHKCIKYVRETLSNDSSGVRQSLILTAALVLQELGDEHGYAMVPKYGLENEVDWLKMPLDMFLEYCRRLSANKPPLIPYYLAARLCRESGDDDVAEYYESHSPNESAIIQPEYMEVLIGNINRMNQP